MAKIHLRWARAVVVRLLQNMQNTRLNLNPVQWV